MALGFVIMRGTSLTALKGPEFYTNGVTFIPMIPPHTHSSRGGRKQPQGIQRVQEKEEK